MSRLLFSLVGSLTLALLVACAGLEDPVVERDPPPQTKLIGMGLVLNVAGSGEPGSSAGGWAWELTVDPNEILSDKLFAADLKGKAILDENFLGQGQDLIPGGFRDMLLADFQATVRVREGASGNPVVLTPESIPYECRMGGAACDPRNDLAPTGIQANSDCQPQSKSNPCGRLVPIPTSEDCDPGGVCDELGHRGDGSQCAKNGFCVTGPVEVPLTGEPGAYTADPSGSVQFGFDDTLDTGFIILEEGGCNDGTWYSEVPSLDDPIGPNGMRGVAGGAPMALEFVMGEPSRLDDGIDSCDPRASPTPSSNLIKFPIQAPVTDR